MAGKIISKGEIEDLGELARVKLSEGEVKKLHKDTEGILDLVSNLKEADISHADDGEVTVKNVYRQDESPHEGGEFTERILNNVPSKKDGFVKVKKIL